MCNKYLLQQMTVTRDAAAGVQSSILYKEVIDKRFFFPRFLNGRTATP